MSCSVSYSACPTSCFHLKYLTSFCLLQPSFHALVLIMSPPIPYTLFIISMYRLALRLDSVLVHVLLEDSGCFLHVGFQLVSVFFDGYPFQQTRNPLSFPRLFCQTICLTSYSIWPNFGSNSLTSGLLVENHMEVLKSFIFEAWKTLSIRHE